MAELRCTEVEELHELDRGRSHRPVTWKVHLAAGVGRRKLGLVVASILIAMAGAYAMLGGALPAILIGLALVVSVGDYLLPITYRITRESASARSLLSHRIIRWEDVRICRLCHDGVKVSPLSRRSRLEAYRGVFLRFPTEPGQLAEHGYRFGNEVLEAIRSVWDGEIR